MPNAESARDKGADEQRIEQLQSELAALQNAHDRLRHSYTRALEELQLMRRRLFVAKSERVDTNADQLAFDRMFEHVTALEKALDKADANAAEDDTKPKKRGTNSTGRRDLSKTALPVVRVEIVDPDREGKDERIGVEESQRMAYQRGGMRRLVVARIVYKDPVAAPSGDSPTEDASGKSRIFVAPMPKELFPRGLLAPSMIAHVLVAKYVMGLPFHRQEQQYAYEGVPLDRATMCRYAEDAGATLGVIVEAARKEALAGAFCLSTDATGIAIQPTPLEDRSRQPTRKGHFFVTLADRDHVFFDYQAKHNSVAVWQMFKGFSGYVQADAHAIYDALFRGTPPKGIDGDESTDHAPPPTEVGCWSHARRKFWEAAVCKQPLGVEGLRRIDALFGADRALADLPPQQRKARRDAVARPLVDAFFVWAKLEYASLRERGLLASALGYAVRQEQALRRFLDDGRLRLENNAAERALRVIAVGRKNWLFCGSDDHASAAANLFSLFASCKLHDLDPEAYLEDIIKVMPYWPRDRYLELAPKYWARTRARLDPKEIERPLGHITVPPPRPAQEKMATS